MQPKEIFLHNLKNTAFFCLISLGYTAQSICCQYNKAPGYLKTISERASISIATTASEKVGLCFKRLPQPKQAQHPKSENRPTEVFFGFETLILKYLFQLKARSAFKILSVSL